MFPVEAIFVPFPNKTGTKLLHPPPPPPTVELVRYIKEGSNHLASRSRLRLYCTSQDEIVIAFVRAYS